MVTQTLFLGFLKHPLERRDLEAETGIEPMYEDLQSSA